LRGNPTSDATLEADRRRIEQTYRSRGFIDVQVSEAILEAAGESEVRVLFPVAEGQRWVLADVRIEGLPVEAAGTLEKTGLAIAKATPWNPAEVATAQRQLEIILADSGYPEGRVTADVATPEPGVATVTFAVEPGDSVEIGDVVIAGLRRTRPSVVRRMLRAAGVESGEPYARYRLLDAQRRLYELGLFRTVELVPIPGQERRAVRGLVVLCEEGAQRSYLVGVGWNETDRFRLTLGWSHLNLFGGAHAFTAEARVSRSEERIQLGLREPRVPGLDVPGYLVVYRTFERIANFTYDQRRRGLWIDVGDRNRLPFRTWYRYEYQIVESDAPPNVLPRELQEARISSVTPTLEWDFRDDPLVPTRGTFSQVSLEWAFPVFDANSEYLKLWGRSTVYGRHPHGTWAAGIRIGAIEPFGTPGEGFDNRLVPLNTRYFAGGANTHRGFERDQLGIPEQTIDVDGNPIGGNALLLINLEYERPITDMFSGVVFLDVGNVWAEPNLVRLADLRYAAGLSLRFNTAAGPLRAEYGWKLDREPHESRGEFFLSFGMPF
jgi:outer membrane protein insertion porin family